MKKRSPESHEQFDIEDMNIFDCWFEVLKYFQITEFPKQESLRKCIHSLEDKKPWSEEFNEAFREDLVRNWNGDIEPILEKIRENNITFGMEEGDVYNEVKKEQMDNIIIAYSDYAKNPSPETSEKIKEAVLELIHQEEMSVHEVVRGEELVGKKRNVMKKIIDVLKGRIEK